MLEITNIHKSFDGTGVLGGVDLRVEQGDVVAILGPSGSGKTTLLRCINFLEKADAGTMVFDGERFELAHMSKKEIARLSAPPQIVQTVQKRALVGNIEL